MQLNLEKYPNLKKFISAHPGMSAEVGECGFGRPCVGIQERGNWLSYMAYEGRDYTEVGRHDLAGEKAPTDAYHKHPCLAVLYHQVEEYQGAADQLEKWVGDILQAGYAIKTYRSFSGLGFLAGGEELSYLANP